MAADLYREHGLYHSAIVVWYIINLLDCVFPFRLVFLIGRVHYYAVISQLQLLTLMADPARFCRGQLVSNEMLEICLLRVLSTGSKNSYLDICIYDMRTLVFNEFLFKNNLFRFLFFFNFLF